MCLWPKALSALADLLYASAIVAHDRQPEYLLRAAPWLLISLGRASLDIAVSNPARLGSTTSCPHSLWLAPMRIHWTHLSQL